MARLWILLASLAFYAVRHPQFLPLLLISVLMNAWMVRQIARDSVEGRQTWVILGVASNIFLLMLFKYGYILRPSIILPLGMSFYTFVQIRYLVDVYNGLARPYGFFDHLLSVCFFPYVTAGPITNPSDTIPQFRDPEKTIFSVADFTSGLVLFTIGLFKKVVIADSLAHYIDPTFLSAAGGNHPSFLIAWFAALGYVLQLYFDFSGYSDMAIGIARLFRIQIPINFNSPYKAINIFDFWRRWHMTLTAFITNYIYIPLTLKMTRDRSRAGKPTLQDDTASWGTYASVIFVPNLVTMLIVGVWHGTGWTFLVFGLLHGLYLALCQTWQHLSQRFRWETSRPSGLQTLAARALTFLSVLISFVFFRSSSIGSAVVLLKGLAGRYGTELPATLQPAGSSTFDLLKSLSISFGGPSVGELLQISGLLAVLYVLIWAAPNSQQLLANFGSTDGNAAEPVGEDRFRWRPSVGWAIVHGVMLAISLWLILAPSRQSAEFIYFKF